MNIVVLTGRLSSDPEVKVSQNGGKQYGIASMSIQDSTDKAALEVDLVVFARSLDALMRTKNGGFLQVQGKLNASQQGQGNRSSKPKVIVENIILPIEKAATSPGTGNGTSGPQSNNGNYQPRAGGNGQSAGATAVAPPVVDTGDNDPFDDF